MAGRGLQWCGRLSYSLYLWHWPVYIVVADRTDLDGWWLTLVRVAATVVVSVIAYQMVEQYVRRRAQWAHGRRGTISTAVAMATVSIWWVALPTPTRLVAGVDATRVLAAPPATSTAPASTTAPPIDDLLPNAPPRPMATR
ncbi:MAG: acyltransferase [Actinobacteria bacterium]|nr:acyltransferase [Actinomycetota bacterium]